MWLLIRSPVRESTSFAMRSTSLRPRGLVRPQSGASKHADELVAELGSVHREAGRRLHAAAEVEEGDERGRLIDPLLVPAGLAKSTEVGLLDCARRLGQLFRVAQQRVGLRI